MTIDGKDMFIYSAAFHYFRCPEELWRDRFRDIKAAGFNTVETYVPGTGMKEPCRLIRMTTVISILQISDAG